MKHWISIPTFCIGLLLVALSIELKTTSTGQSLRIREIGADFSAGECIAKRAKIPLERWEMAAPRKIIMIKEVGIRSYLTDEYDGELRYRNLPYPKRTLTKQRFETVACPEDLAR